MPLQELPRMQGFCNHTLIQAYLPAPIPSSLQELIRVVHYLMVLVRTTLEHLANQCQGRCTTRLVSV